MSPLPSTSTRRQDSIIEPECPFCTEPSAVTEGLFSYMRYDRHPVSPGHALIIPWRHVSSFFDLSEDERQEMLALVMKARALIDAKHSPDGYNIGINVGEAAGQSVWHAHMHVIPRYRGDAINPRGGVRGVIPSKQSY